MNYQSYGTPLQEQEDWPKIWSANHTQPLMVVESGFPYPFQFLYFDGPKENWLFAENASRFFGDGRVDQIQHFVLHVFHLPVLFGVSLGYARFALFICALFIILHFIGQVNLFYARF